MNKYKLRDRVWYIKKRDMYDYGSGIINMITITDEGVIMYGVKHSTCMSPESEVFATYEACIEALVDKDKVEVNENS